MALPYGREVVSLAEAMKRFDTGKIVRRFGSWAVTDYGVECLATYYPIRAERLWEGQGWHPWERQLGTRQWLESADDLCRALEFGRSYHGAKHGGAERVISDAELESNVRNTLAKHVDWFQRDCDHEPHMVNAATGQRLALDLTRPASIPERRCDACQEATGDLWQCESCNWEFCEDHWVMCPHCDTPYCEDCGSEHREDLNLCWDCAERERDPGADYCSVCEASLQTGERSPVTSDDKT